MSKLLKCVSWIRWPVAIGLLIALAWHEGMSDSIALIGRSGLALLWILPFHALPLLLDARAWHLLLDERISLGVLWRIAVVREAIGRLLPVLGIGGEVAGVRLAGRYLDASTVSASVVVEVLVTMGVQFALSALGLTLLFAYASDACALTKGIAMGLGLSLPVAACAFVVAKQGGLFNRVEAFARKWIDVGLDGKRIDIEIRSLLQRHALCMRAFAWQFAGYAIGTVEVSWILDALGYPTSFVACICIEALTQAARNAVFFAPAGLGVQEATIIGVAGFFGIDREIAMSLAIVRRAREFVWGGIALGLMQALGPREVRQSTSYEN